MKKLLSIGLVSLILLQSFSKVWIILSFKVNQDYIARVLCINRDKPGQACNGKCYLMKQMKAQEEQEKKQLPQKLRDQKEVTFCFDFPLWQITVPADRPAGGKSPAYILHRHDNPVVGGIFHPPGSAATA